MGDETRLDVTMLSAQGLKDLYAFGTMSPFAKVWIDSTKPRCTPPAVNAGCSPVWDHKVSLPLSPQVLKDETISLSIEIWTQASTGDTIIGRANLPLKDIISSASLNKSHFMACQLLRPSGRVQGLVNFCLEIRDAKAPPSNPHSKDSVTENKSRRQDDSSLACTSNDATSRFSILKFSSARMKGKDLESTQKLSAADDHNIGAMKTTKALVASGSLGKFNPAQYGPRLPPDSKQRAVFLDDSKTNLQVGTPNYAGPHGFAFQTSETHGSAPQAVQNSLPEIGGKMFGGVAGALLLGQALDVKAGNSQNQGQGHHGGSSTVGDWQVSEPGSGGSSAGGLPAP